MAEPFTPAVDAAGALRAFVEAAYEIAVDTSDEDDQHARDFGLAIEDYGQDDDNWHTVTLEDGRRLRWNVTVELLTDAPVDANPNTWNRTHGRTVWEMSAAPSDELDRDESEAVCRAINAAAGAQRPWADPDSVRFFVASFAADSIRAALEGPEGRLRHDKNALASALVKLTPPVYVATGSHRGDYWSTVHECFCSVGHRCEGCCGCVVLDPESDTVTSGDGKTEATAYRGALKVSE